VVEFDGGGDEMPTGLGDRRRDGGVGGDDPAAACRAAFLFLEKEREIRVARLYHEHRRDRYRDLILLTGLIGLQCEYLAGSIGPGANSRPGPPMTVSEAIESPPAAWARSWAFMPMRELRVAYGRYTGERRRLGMWLSSRSKGRAEIEAEGTLEEIADRVARLVGGRRREDTAETHRPIGKRAPRPIRPLPMGGPAAKPIAGPNETPIAPAEKPIAPFEEPPLGPPEDPPAPREKPPTASVATAVAAVAAPKTGRVEQPKAAPTPSPKPAAPPRFADPRKAPVPFATEPPERRRNWKALLLIDIAAAAGIAIAIIALWGGFGSSSPSDQPRDTKARHAGVTATPPLVRPLEGPLRDAVADGPHGRHQSKPDHQRKPQDRERTQRSASTPSPATSVPASSDAETTTPTVAATVPAATTPAPTTPTTPTTPPSSSSSGGTSSSSGSSCQPEEFGFEC
jgi:hypothetical protein